MGYGGLPNFTEYSESGKVLLDGTLRAQRAGLQDVPRAWEGHPPGRPSVARDELTGRDEGRRELERRHERGRLARSGGILPDRAHPGRAGTRLRFPEHDRGPLARAVRRRAGA